MSSAISKIAGYFPTHMDFKLEDEMLLQEIQ